MKRLDVLSASRRDLIRAINSLEERVDKLEKGAPLPLPDAKAPLTITDIEDEEDD
jgi:hypothetical protein